MWIMQLSGLIGSELLGSYCTKKSPAEVIHDYKTIHLCYLYTKLPYSLF